MRRIPSFLLLGLLVLLPVRAEAQTSIQNLLGLKAAGFSDELLIATFQSDSTVFYLTADDLIYLRQQGVSERVLIAMLATRRPPPAPPLPAAAPPVTPGPAGAGAVAGSPVPVESPGGEPPVIVEVTQQVEQRVEVEAPRRSSTRTVFVPVSVPRARREPVKKAEPLYWGFGGRPRPDPASRSTGSGGGETKPTSGGGGR